MRNLGWTSSLPLAVILCASTARALPSFPGAQGFGAGATGGRGGEVIKVTSLAASGPGSLQDALDAGGPRIIVFAVSGIIEADVLIPHGDVTIAGQTAPGGGITIAGRLIADYDADISNVVIRHVRVRPTYDGSAGDQFDGAQFSTSSNVILDHMSIAWGVDETVDLYETDDVTVQFCTIEEGGTEGHPEGEHNYGLINGPDGHRVSIHHNLFIHQKNRNPAVANGPAEVVNNVAYDVRHGFVHHNPASGPFDIVGNTYIRGPEDILFPFFFDDENEFGAGDLGYWLADNAIDDPGVFVGIVNDPWSEAVHPTFEDMLAPASFRSESFYAFDGVTPGYVPVTIQASDAGRESVVAQAGAFPRDVVTRRVLAEMEARGGGWGAHPPADLMEGLTPGAYPADADDDGMPDAWERAHGLDPSDAGDATSAMPSGYTAIEDFINEVATELTGEPPVDPGTTSSSSGGSASNGAGAGAGGGGNGSGSGSEHGAGAGGVASGGVSATRSAPGSGDITGEGCACRTPGRAPGGVHATLLALVGILALRARRSRSPEL